MIRGVVLLTAMLAASSMAMRLSAQSGSYPVMAVSGFVAGTLVVGIFLELAKRFQIRSDLWVVGISAFIIAIANQVWPSTYPDTLGWSFVGGLVVGIVALASFNLIRLSKTNERTR